MTMALKQTEMALDLGLILAIRDWLDAMHQTIAKVILVIIRLLDMLVAGHHTITEIQEMLLREPAELLLALVAEPLPAAAEILLLERILSFRPHRAYCNPISLAICGNGQRNKKGHEHFSVLVAFTNKSGDYRRCG